jgi:phenylacetic acid degradation operon negative regulatory protein
MNSSPPSQDWLLVFLSVLDVVMRPSPANILRPFEDWVHRKSLRQWFRSLERAGHFERAERGPTRRPTSTGHATAWGGLDPRERWGRAWDGQWRLVIYDLPSREVGVRQQLARWLHAQRLGYLQNSVWISPDPVNSQPAAVRRLRPTSEAFTVLTCRPEPPASNASLVEGAWDFAKINQRYQTAMDVVADGQELVDSAEPARARLAPWLRAERAAWLAAATIDPFLPEPLLPADYAGRRAWERRQAVFGALAQRLVAGAGR